MGADEDFDEVRRMINRMLADAVQGKPAEPAESFNGGFAGRVWPKDEERRAPPRRYVVQVPPDPSLPGPEVSAAGDVVYVTMDLRGMRPTEVRTKVSGRLLFVEVKGPQPVQRIVELPVPVETDVRCSVREGVLDLTLRRRPTPP